MQYIHSTVPVIRHRLQEGTGGSLDFGAGPRRDTADMALFTAHNLIMNVLDLQKEHFKLEALDKPLEQSFQDCPDIWERDGDNLQTGR